jgi:putative lumazine-binding protein
MTTAVTATEEAESFATQEAIAATLQRYIDAASSGKGSLMRTAFAAGARVRGTYGGKPVDWALPEFCDLIDKGGPIADLQARIVAIDYAGNAGMARLEARNWRGTRYTDFFVLIKRDDGWRISDKVFFAHSRA